MSTKKRRSNPERPSIKCQGNNTTQPVQFTIITSVFPNTLTKEYHLKNGDILQSTVAHMSEGQAQLCSVPSARAFADVLHGMQPNQALCFGVTGHEKIKILSASRLHKNSQPQHAVSRTKEYFFWPTGPGIMMLDYDPDRGRPFDKHELTQALQNVLPELTYSAYVWWCSSSSFIYNGTQEAQGLRGQRLYLLVADATDIPRAGAELARRLWVAGHGYIKISRSGSMLPRTLIDTSVWQANRLDFAAGAACHPPLQQHRGAPVVHDGSFLDTRLALAAPEPGQASVLEGQYQKALSAAKLKAEPEATKARVLYIEAEAHNLLKRQEKSLTTESLEQAKTTISKALDGCFLDGDFEILLDNGQSITVRQALDNPGKFHNRLTKDPLEPEYNKHRTVGKLYLLGGPPVLHSYAHGGRTFTLTKKPRRIELVQGQTADATDATLKYLREEFDLFDQGSLMVTVHHGKALPLNSENLAYTLGCRFQYWRCISHGEVQQQKNIDPPRSVLQQILAIPRDLKPLKAVITAPIIDQTGRVINRPGYDEKSQLFLTLSDNPVYPVPSYVTAAELTEAYQTLASPFSGFTPATPLDHAILIAAVLTAVIRPILPTAPAIGIDAPVQGTGKTYLAQCLGMLATGTTPDPMPHIASDDEIRKRILATLFSGSQVLLWDNIIDYFDSPSLAAMLTSSTFKDRVLGASREIALPTRILVILTGNNLTLAGDLPRRVLKCRLDAQMEHPAARRFTSNPLHQIQDQRQRLVAAALTLIRAYLTSDECASGGAVPDSSTASFELWDEMVRQTVAWLALHKGFDDLEDPGRALIEAVARDPEAETVGLMLDNLQELFQSCWFTAADVLVAIEGSPGTTRDLAEALTSYSRGNRLSSRSIGRTLAHREGRIVAGKRIEARSNGRTKTFRIAEL